MSNSTGNASNVYSVRAPIFSSAILLSIIALFRWAYKKHSNGVQYYHSSGYLPNLPDLLLIVICLYNCLLFVCTTVCCCLIVLSVADGMRTYACAVVGILAMFVEACILHNLWTKMYIFMSIELLLLIQCKRQAFFMYFATA